MDRSEESKTKLFQMSEHFKEEIEKCEDFVQRMNFSNEYFRRWYSRVNANQDHEEFPIEEFKKGIIEMGGFQSDKRVFLFSPSVEEVNLFASFFDKVGFVALPQLNVELPKNSEQFSHDKQYNIVDKNGERKTSFADYVFSHHVVEHVHPADIKDHLQTAFDFLVPGGQYLIICPSRWRILKDDISDDQDQKMSANHHVGRSLVSG